MTEKDQAWFKTRRDVILLTGLSGMLIGILIGTWNADVLGWALLRVAVLGVSFAWAARVVVHRLMRAWLESKVKESEIQAIAAAKKGASPKLAGG
ncbi:MAG: hypothetical protein ACOY3I_00775 [Verrucomicrobiota bacterium]